MDAIQTPVPETGPSAWENFSTSVSDGLCWAGQKIHAAGSYIYEMCANVIEWATPFFQNVGKWIVETWDSAKEAITQNSDVSMAIGGTFVVTVLVMLGLQAACSRSDAEPASSQPAPSAI